MNRPEAAEFLRRRRDQEVAEHLILVDGDRSNGAVVFSCISRSPTALFASCGFVGSSACAMIPFAGQSRINILRDPIMFGPAMFGAALGPFVCAAIILVCPIAVVHAQ